MVYRKIFQSFEGQADCHTTMGTTIRTRDGGIFGAI